MTDNEKDASVAELARPLSLSKALAQAFDGVGRRLAFVAFRSGREWASAFVADDGRAGPDAPDAPMPVGCLAKLLTATLATRMFANRGITLETRVVDLLDLGTSPVAFADVTLRHLLEHTHGIDDSLLSRPTLRAGFVDTNELAQRASAAQALSSPGAVYSYSNLGAWLIAAALEHCASRPYAALLQDELLAPLGIRFDCKRLGGSESGFVCPSSGMGLLLSVTDWLRFLASAADAPWPRESSNGAGTITLLPGWNPLERGIWLGWKYHGHGWFGHQSVWPGSSALVRVNPARAIGLALISRDHAASAIAGRMFGAALPELFDLRTPPLLGRGAPVDPQRYVGRYASAAWRAEISLRGDTLELRVHDRARGLRQHAVLLPAAAHTFFARPPAIEFFPYVQLVTTNTGALSYLWNGRFVLPRL